MKWKLVLCTILSLGFFLRTFQLNWDDGYHFHPDERHIVMVTEKLQWVSPFVSFEDFLITGSPFNPVFFHESSPMNPGFFAYGSFPLYLLAVSGWLASAFDPQYATYDGLNLVGRVLSAFFDTATILCIFGITRQLFSSKKSSNNDDSAVWLALIAALLYCVCVLPIQLSHFYAVDTILTFFFSLILWILIKNYQTPKLRLILLLAISLGLAVATKTTGLILLAPVIVGLYWPTVVNLCLIIISRIRQKHLSSRLHSTLLRQFALSTLLLIFTILAAASVFIIVEPYAFIDSEQFISDHKQQSQMATNAWVFPYTLQYVGTKPYLYPLAQIANWGMGWPLFLVGLIGLISLVITLLKSAHQWLKKPEAQSATATYGRVLLLVTFSLYFGFFGQSAVKFMRYYAPLYPILVVFAADGLWHISRFVFPPTSKRQHLSLLLIASLVIVPTTVWAIAFLSMYTQPNTRITASQWLAKNIPSGASLGVEHWDDSLPVPPWHTGFQHISLPLYEPDTPAKWELMAQNLYQSDVIILASNRLIDPLTRLSWKFPATNHYYQQLYAGNLGFVKAAEFTNYPRLGNLVFPDQAADESFHVYDHPKVVIFVKQQPLTPDQYYDRIATSRLDTLIQ